MSLLLDALAFSVPWSVAAGLGTWAGLWTAHNTAVQQIRETGARPSLRAAINAAPDEELAARYWELRSAADRRAAA